MLFKKKTKTKTIIYVLICYYQKSSSYDQVAMDKLLWLRFVHIAYFNSDEHHSIDQNLCLFDELTDYWFKFQVNLKKIISFHKTHKMCIPWGQTFENSEKMQN